MSAAGRGIDFSTAGVRPASKAPRDGARLADCASMRYAILACLALVLLCAVSAWAQQNVLPYRPVAAEYSTALDRLIMVSSDPNTLHIYDPVSNAEQAVSLAQTPLALSISPDGLHAAVGHDGLVTYVDLANRSVIRTFNVAPTVKSLVLSDSWIYVMPTLLGNSFSIDLSSGSVIPNDSVLYGYEIRGQTGCFHVVV